MAEGEIGALKEALCNQYLIMKKLYVELEEEREASATAATEALSMILRLQREKAAEKMEACQYERMAEERMHHAEESLEMLEEVVQQKEMEIESLRFQVKSYKQKLTNLGISIPDFGEMMLCENKSSSGINVGSNKSSFHGVFRRNASLPSLLGDEFCSDKGFLDDESRILSSGISVWRRIGDFTNQHIGTGEKEVPDLFEELVANKGQPEYKYQADEGNKSLKELTQAKNSAIGSCTSVASNEMQSTSSPIGSIGSWFSAPSSDASTDSTKSGKGMMPVNEAISRSPSRSKDNENASRLERQFSGKVVYSAFFHDIFEVPDSHKGCKPGEPCKKLLQDTILETNSMIDMPNMMPKEAADYLFKDDECLNKAFMGNHNGSNFSMPCKGAIISRVSKTSTPKKGTSVNYHSALMDPRVGIATFHSDIEQLRRRLQQLVDERVILQEDSERGKEQLKLLKEMFKQLNTIETHIKRSTSKKSSLMDESSLVSVMEAVLSFSI